MRSRRVIVVTAVLCVVASCSRDPQKLKRQFVASGDHYMAEKNYAEAVVQYRNAVVRDSSFGEARFKLAAAYAELGDLRNALREYVRAADLMPDDVVAQLRAGNGLLAAGQYPEAKSRALAALAKDPKNVEALVLLGNALGGMKDIDGAIAQIEDAIDTDPRRVLAYTNLGELEMAQGRRDVAEETFKRAVEVDPKSETAHLALANFYWSANERPKAENELKTALDLDPKSVSANRALAVFYSLSGRPAEAESYLKVYAGVAPDVGPKLVLADYYTAARKPEQAVAVLTPLLATKDGFIPAKLRLAAADFAASRHDQAYKALDEVFKKDPKNEAALLEKGRFLMSEHKAREALVPANTAIAGNPSSVGGQYLKGMALKATGSNDEAIKAFQEVLRLRPAASVAILELAALNLVRGDAGAAAEYANQAIKNEPRSVSAHFLLAKALLAQGNVKGAEPEVQRLARAIPSSADTQALLGDLYWASKDNERAREAYDRAFKLRPASIDAIAGLTRVDLSEHKSDKARSRIESLLEKTAKSEQLLVLAGNTYLASGDSKQAEATFRRVIQEYPSNIEAYGRLGAIYGAQHRLDDAKQEYEDLARKQPKAAVVATTMVGMILTLQNKPDEARKEFERALALDPQMPVAANNLAWDYAETSGNLDMALQLAQTAKARLPNSAEVSDTLGWIYYKKGLAGLAVTALEEASGLAPSNPSIRYRLGLAYLKGGDKKKARESLERALKLDSKFKEAADATRTLATLKG